MSTFLKLHKFIFTFVVVVFCTSCEGQNQDDIDQGLIGYWKLSDDVMDRSGNDLQTEARGEVRFEPADGSQKSGSAVFDGRDFWLEVDPNPALQLGSGDFSVASWIYTDGPMDDVPGDIISWYDPSSRKGFNFGLIDNATTTSHSNFRQVGFGIDDNHASGWIDYGRPGNALLAFGLAEYKGDLYAGTCEAGVEEMGHVYRYAGEDKWEDCGSPDSSNSVVALAVLNDGLYAGTGHYRVKGSSLPESENIRPGGRVFRYQSSKEWEDCGQLPSVETIGGMVVYKGKLYASSMYTPGFFRYEGGKEWVDCGTPDNKRVVALAVYDGYLYATSWDWGHVYRYDGESWEDCGQVGGEENTQTYAFAVYDGNLYVATWRSGRVFRFDGPNQWKDVGRLGEELEVMGMVVHNGRLIGGTLPLGEVYSYEGDTTWTRMDQLDKTPDVIYRRAWTMAEHDGKLFCSTLPSGKIYGFEAGKSVSSKEELPAGWQHVAAVKTADRLALYVNGELADERVIPDSISFDLDINAPLRIGFGTKDYFNGRMRELRLYNRAIRRGEIQTLMER